jgi:hypothetical protein
MLRTHLHPRDPGFLLDLVYPLLLEFLYPESQYYLEDQYFPEPLLLAHQYYPEPRPILLAPDYLVAQYYLVFQHLYYLEPQ